MQRKIQVKNSKEIIIMKEGGHIAALVLKKLAESLKPGISSKTLDAMAEKLILSHNAIPSFKDFNGYPSATCISINNEVVHGIPSNRQIKAGDIVGIDLGVYFKGYHADTAITCGVGKITSQAEKLIKTTKSSLSLAIATIKPNVHIGDIQEIIQKTIEKEGFSVIRDLSGHGIGRYLQEPPSILNFGKKGKGFVLKEGMTLAFEPMVAIGDWRVRILKDGWTVVTADNSLAAHFEHTVVVTNKGAEILTKI